MKLLVKIGNVLAVRERGCTVQQHGSAADRLAALCARPAETLGQLEIAALVPFGEPPGAPRLVIAGHRSAPLNS